MEMAVKRKAKAMAKEKVFFCSIRFLFESKCMFGCWSDGNATNDGHHTRHYINIRSRISIFFFLGTQPFSLLSLAIGMDVYVINKKKLFIRRSESHKKLRL